MTIAAHSRFTFSEYVALEAASSIKHEFADGLVFAMAGGTPEHPAIAARLARVIGNALVGKPCNVYTSDLRVRVPSTGLATYPDLSVICGQLETDPEDANSATNPVLLVEVLSESTAHYDRGEKLAHYQRLPSVKEVLLVAHDSRQLELWRRLPEGGWALEVSRGAATLELGSVSAVISLGDVYQGGF